MDIHGIVYSAIELEVIESRGFNAWLSRKYIIYEMLDKLWPTTPGDDTFGFIAYNVPGKVRMKMKTGKFLTRKLKLNDGYLNDASLRRIADSINQTINPDCNRRIVSGDSIYRNYRDGIGGSSCMAGSNAEKVGMYIDNPKIYRQITMHRGGDTARAMIVKLDNGSYLMDRIYSTCSFLVDKMVDKARSEKWFYRESTSASDYDICDYSGMSVEDYSLFVVSGLEYTDGEVPFQDTLTRFKISGESLNISHRRSNLDYDGTLDSTEGYIDNENSTTCYNCEFRGDVDCMYTDNDGEFYCESCWNELFFCCPKCECACRTDGSVCIEDTAEDWCSDCANSHAQSCQKCGEVNENDYDIIEDVVYCDSCAENFPYCNECEEKVLEVNDNDLCEICQTNKQKQEDAEKQDRKDAETLAYFSREDIFQI